MTERGRENPLSREVTQHLRERIVRRVDPMDMSYCALLGASEEMIALMQQTGSLLNPSRTNPDYSSAVITRGYGGRIKSLDLTEQTWATFSDPNAARVGAEDPVYPPLHYFLAELGKPINNEIMLSQAEKYLSATDPDAQEMQLLAHVPREEIIANQTRATADILSWVPKDRIVDLDEVTAEARTRRGFLLGVDTKVADRFTVKQIHQDFPDVEISFGKLGMPYGAIGAIEPLGRHERRFLDSL